MADIPDYLEYFSSIDRHLHLLWNPLNDADTKNPGVNKIFLSEASLVEAWQWVDYLRKLASSIPSTRLWPIFIPRDRSIKLLAAIESINGFRLSLYQSPAIDDTGLPGRLYVTQAAKKVYVVELEDSSKALEDWEYTVRGFISNILKMTQVQLLGQDSRTQEPLRKGTNCASSFSDCNQKRLSKRASRALDSSNWSELTQGMDFGK